METIFKAIGLVIIGGLMLMLLFFFFWFFLAVIGLMIGIFAVAWVCGIPITVKQNGVKIGYIKRTKFYRTPF